MRISSLSPKVLLASVLLSHASPLLMNAGWAMDSKKADKENISINKTTRSKGRAYDALSAFDEKKDNAGDLLTQLRKDGAMWPDAYLKHLKIEFPVSFEPIPQPDLDLSQSWLEASLCYRDYLKGCGLITMFLS